MARFTCECSDPGCPVDHRGECGKPATVALERIDMDPGLMPFCDACAQDALESGVFDVRPLVRMHPRKR